MEDRYMDFKRLLAFLAAVGLWGVSMYFSYSGFKFESTEILWFGVVLALTVTVVELVFNTKIKDLNPTLIIIGIVCYLYGTYTNITGFYILQHGNLDNFFTKSSWVIPVFAGLVCEVLPEALLAWSWGVFDKGDLVGNIGEIFGTTHSSPKNAQQRSNARPTLQSPPKPSYITEELGEFEEKVPAPKYVRSKPNYHPTRMNVQGQGTRGRLNE
jgi:hypothetical protein